MPVRSCISLSRFAFSLAPSIAMNSVSIVTGVITLSYKDSASRLAVELGVLHLVLPGIPVETGIIVLRHDAGDIGPASGRRSLDHSILLRNLTAPVTLRAGSDESMVAHDGLLYLSFRPGLTGAGRKSRGPILAAPGERGLLVPSYPAGRVHQAVQGLRGARALEEVRLLQDLGEGVEETPAVPGRRELGVPGLAPLLQDLGDLRHGRDPVVEGLDDDVVGLRVGHLEALVGVDPVVLPLAEVADPADGGLDQVGEIALDEDGVLAADLDLAAEGEVVADEDARADHQTRGEALVVRIAEADDQRVVDRVVAVLELEHAEVALAFVRERMGLRH